MKKSELNKLKKETKCNQLVRLLTLKEEVSLIIPTNEVVGYIITGTMIPYKAHNSLEQGKDRLPTVFHTDDYFYALPSKEGIRVKSPFRRYKTERLLWQDLYISTLANLAGLESSNKEMVKTHDGLKIALKNFLEI